VSHFSRKSLQIIYRGLTIPEVIALLPRQGDSPIVEAVFWLLLTGDIPTQQQTASLVADWTSRRQKCIEWWSGPRGETIISILRSMPETMTPLYRLSVALAIFDVSKHAKNAKRHGALPYTYWEVIERNLFIAHLFIISLKEMKDYGELFIPRL